MCDFAALACILLLGVPHGALDGEIARTALRPVFRRAWFVVFSVPYLSLAAGVLIAWRVAPEATLAVFLAASVYHFGEEDAAAFRTAQVGRSWLAIVARGGMAVALPVLLHQGATARFLGQASLMAMRALPDWLVVASVAWCPVALCWATRAVRRRNWRDLADAALVGGVFVLLPLLPAFALYFVCVHAPRHMASVIREGRAPRVRSMRDAFVYAAPITVLTLLIGAALWPFFPGAAADRLLTLTIQGLSALTLPHMLLDCLVAMPNRASAHLIPRPVRTARVAKSPIAPYVEA